MHILPAHEILKNMQQLPNPFRQVYVQLLQQLIQDCFSLPQKRLDQSDAHDLSEVNPKKRSNPSLPLNVNRTDKLISYEAERAYNEHKARLKL